MARLREDEMTELIQHHWNEKAATFDRELGHGMHSDAQHGAWMSLLADLAGPVRLRVLDVGCGTGFLAMMFAELGHTVTGIDLAEQMLEGARAKAKRSNLKIDYRLENAVELRDPSSTYDLVVARHVIWTLPDPAKGVMEWQRVLKPGGRLALVEGKWDANRPKTERKPTLRSMLAATAYAGIAFASNLVDRAARPALFRRLYARKYQEVEAQLPFTGGPTAERLGRFLEAHGMHNIEVRPLMDADLWGKVPPFPRYLMVATR